MSENVNAVVAKASHRSPNRPDAPCCEIADDQPDEERHEVPVGSTAAEFQNQRLCKPTCHEGEPKVVHGVTHR